jgi:hypothetical protein
MSPAIKVSLLDLQVSEQSSEAEYLAVIKQQLERMGASCVFILLTDELIIKEICRKGKGCTMTLKECLGLNLTRFLLRYMVSGARQIKWCSVSYNEDDNEWAVQA